MNNFLKSESFGYILAGIFWLFFANIVRFIIFPEPFGKDTTFEIICFLYFTLSIVLFIIGILKTPSINVIDAKAYEVWKQNGRISLKYCDIFGFVGIFILGWPLWYVYDRAGEKGWKFFIPIILLYVIGFRIHIIFGIIGALLFIYTWIHIRMKIKAYEEQYQKQN